MTDLTRKEPIFDLSEYEVGNRVSRDWLNAVPSTVAQRRVVLQNLLSCSGATREQLEVALRTPKFDKVKLTSRFIVHLEKPIHGARKDKPCAKSTIQHSLSFLMTYYRYIDTNFDSKKFLKENFPVYAGKASRLIVNRARALTRSQVRATLVSAKTPKYKAMIEIFVSTGARIEEVLALKIGNLKLDLLPAIVSFETQDSTTKTHTRESFLSQEAVGIVRNYLRTLPLNEQGSGNWLFPTEEKRKISGKLRVETFGSKSGHQEAPSARHGITEAFNNAGDEELRKTSVNGRRAFHPHTFRSTFLAIARASGYSEDYAKQLCGHDIGTEASYIVNEEMAKMWLDKCESAFTFLSGSDAETEQRIQKIERDNRFLAQVLRVRMEDANKTKTVAKELEDLKALADRLGVPFEELYKYVKGRIVEFSKQEMEALEDKSDKTGVEE